MNKEYKEKGYVVVKNFISEEMADYLRFYIISLRDRLPDQDTNSYSSNAGNYAVGRVTGPNSPHTMGFGDDMGLSHYVYAVPPFELLLDFKKDFIQETLEWPELVPTNTYARIYYSKFSTLPHHLDRASCEVSVTINLGGKYKNPWSIWCAEGEHLKTQKLIDEGKSLIEIADEMKIFPNTSKAPKQQEGDKWVESVLQKGDAHIIMGNRVSHWRNTWVCEPGDWQAQLFLHYLDETGMYADWKYDKRRCLNY